MFFLLCKPIIIIIIIIIIIKLILYKNLGETNI
jgi:hypothetical protein